MTKLLNIKQGDQYGHWTLLKEQPKKNGQRVWLCKCICGTQKVLRQSALVAGKTKSCGCHKEPRNIIDLTNKKFGMLKVIRRCDRKEDGRILWHCRCDCGNLVDVKGVYLTKGWAKSCGCLKKSQNKVNLRDKYNEQYVDNVNTSLLDSKLRSDNKSGVKGVSLEKSSGKWVAYITVGGRRINLGKYKDKKKAIQARQKAEEKYHKPYLEAKNERNRQVHDPE